MVSVMLVDDNALYRDALAEQLIRQAWVERVRSAPDTATLVDLYDVCRPDVIVVSLASLDRCDVLQMVRNALPDAKVVAIAVSEDEDEALACARAGVMGIVLRGGIMRDLENAVAGAALDQTVYPPSVVRALVRSVSHEGGGGSGDESHLTSREREVLVLIEQGLTNREISQRLGVEVRTVKNHVHNVLAKLRVSRRSEAAARLRSTRVPDLKTLVVRSRSSLDAVVP